MPKHARALCPPPQHVAIVMDGNGRWAKKNNVSTINGHRAGAEALRRTVRHAAQMGVKYLTTYTFSTENWRRPTVWVQELMGLLKHYLRYEIDELVRSGVRLEVIGDFALLDPALRSEIQRAVDKTQNGQEICLVLALSYGGRSEITDAMKQIASAILKGDLSPQDITSDVVEAHLYAPHIPAPDLLIRTSGEMRISNFLLWQLAYTELYFTPTLWPDFNETCFDEAIQHYHLRERRYGEAFASHTGTE